MPTEKAARKMGYDLLATAKSRKCEIANDMLAIIRGNKVIGLIEEYDYGDLVERRYRSIEKMTRHMLCADGSLRYSSPTFEKFDSRKSIFTDGW